MFEVRSAILSLMVFVLTSFNVSHAQSDNIGKGDAFADDKTITLALLEFPPHSYTRAGSMECIGYAVEATRFIFAKHGFSLTAICAPAIRVYRMLETGEIDLTINIKSTRLLQDSVDFFDPAYGQLELIMISHADRGFENMVSAIRGFDYHGQRQALEKQGYTFQDTPGSIDAINIFMRERTRHLITYKAPFKFYLESNGFTLPGEVTVKCLAELKTHYAISKNYKHYRKIMQALKQEAKQLKTERFEELLPFL